MAHMELTKIMNLKNSLRPHTGSMSFPQKRRPRELPIACDDSKFCLAALGTEQQNSVLLGCVIGS
jgi:hypothetical protein